MDRRATISVLIGGLVAVLFAAVATSGAVDLIEGPPRFMDATEQASSLPTVSIPPVEEELEENTREPLELPPVIETILRVLFYLTLSFVAVLIAVFAWRYRPRLRWRRRRPRSTGFDRLDDVAATIAADAQAQRAALRHGSPRNAIVECWLRLEAAVAAAGVRRDPADTAQELTHRVLTNAHVDRAAIDRLAALYREARFSTHTMNETDRRAAIAALDTVHAGLAVGAGSTNHTRTDAEVPTR